MVHINITLPDELHKQIKIAAASNDKTVKEIVNEALEQRTQKRGRYK